MPQPVGFRKPECTGAWAYGKCAREAMAADTPIFFVTWSCRAHAAMDSQLRRRRNRKAEMEQDQQHQHPQQHRPPASPKKREWWRLDPNASDKYKPIEPPATPDPNLVPTLDRIVFGWEAPLSPLEQVIQEDVRRHFPKLHEWIVRRAVERAGLMPEPISDAKLPDAALLDIDDCNADLLPAPIRDHHEPINLTDIDCSPADRPPAPSRDREGAVPEAKHGDDRNSPNDPQENHPK